jgi:hypothetical protein
MNAIKYLKKYYKNSKRKPVFIIHFHGLDNISLGISINFLKPNIEIHLPFWFIKIGWNVFPENLTMEDCRAYHENHSVVFFE